MPIHMKRLEDGWFQKIDWDRANKYEEDLREFLMEEEERKEEARMKNEPFEKGFWVYKDKNETWKEYDARRR